MTEGSGDLPGPGCKKNEHYDMENGSDSLR